MSAHGVPVVAPLRGAPPGSAGPPSPDYGGSPLARALAAQRGHRDPDPLPSDGPLLHPVAARALATLVLGTFGVLHWMQMMEPMARTRAWNAVGAMVVVMGGLVLAAQLPRHFRQLAALAVLAAGVALAMLAGGIADEQLWPSQWGGIASAAGRGIDALPGARVPYRGVDPDLQLVIPLGGALLAVLGAALALWPRRRGRRAGFTVPALIVLVTLYAVPAVALFLTAEPARGALAALLVIAFLRLDRLRRRDAPPAVALAAVTAVVALAIGPALDKDDPWWDYESWSQSAAGAKSTTFQWNHSYGPLDWPRDGRELLRIESKNRAYWKADNLDVFDGRRWVTDNVLRGGDTGALLTDGVDFRYLERWRFRIRVTVRNLRSPTLPVAGTAEDVDWSRPTMALRPGIYGSPGRTLRRGDSYTARVYVPQPSNEELRTAGSNWEGYGLHQFTKVQAFKPLRPGESPRSARAAAPFRVISRAFGTVPVIDGTPSELSGADDLRESELARSYALSRELLQGADSIFDYVRAVERYLRDDFRYSESPPKGSGTLDGFLFDTKIGYCQQFSGAMALMLRLGGVPARVATGFSPGSYDRKAKQYVVRDIDAHSWVEAWFPGIGWVVLDPTPATAPPRSQASLQGAPSAGTGDVRDIGTRTADPRAGAADGADGGPPWALILGGLAAAAALTVAGRRIRRRRRFGPRPAMSELERALRIAEGGLAPDTTLTALEARFAATPPAAGYVRALRAQRYAPAGGAPTPSQRRGLRRALGRGRGLAGRVRAMWALPPHPRRPRLALLRRR